MVLDESRSRQKFYVVTACRRCPRVSTRARPKVTRRIELYFTTSRRAELCIAPFDALNFIRRTRVSERTRDAGDRRKREKSRRTRIFLFSRKWEEDWRIEKKSSDERRSHFREFFDAKSASFVIRAALLRKNESPATATPRERRGTFPSRKRATPTDVGGLLANRTARISIPRRDSSGSPPVEKQTYRLGPGRISAR